MKSAVLFMLFCIHRQQESSATSKVEDYCDAGQFDQISKSAVEIDDLRAERDNQFTDNWRDIIDYLRDPKENSDELFDTFMAAAILLLVFMFVLIVSFVVFICLCCGKCETNDPQKGCVFASWFFFILFLALFVLILVFLALSQQKVEDTLCAVFKLPSGIVDGYQDDHSQFIGLANLRNTLSAFSTEMDQLPNVTNNLTNIQQVNPSTLSNQAWASLSDYVQTTKPIQVNNGSGVKKTPFSILNLQEGINYQIEEEFTGLDLASERVVQGANDALLLTQNVFRAGVKSTLDLIVIEINNLIAEIEDVTEPGSDHVEEGMDYAEVGYWILFSFALLTFILCIIILIIITMVCSSGKCVNRLQLGRVLLVVVGVCVIILSILVFIILVGSAVMSGFCGFVGKLNKNQVSVLYEYEDDIDQSVIQFAELCLFSNSTGNINEIIIDDTLPAQFVLQSSQLNTVESVLDGFSSYRQFRVNTSALAASPFVKEYNDSLNVYKNGDQADIDITTDLNRLNDLIDCNNESFQLNQSQCEDTGCKGIFETLTYTAPGCTTDATSVNSLFSNFKQYQADIVNYVNSSQTKLTDTQSSSVQTTFSNAKQAFLNIDADSKAVEDKLSNSLAFRAQYSSNWENISDCRNLRKILFDFELETCLDFNYYLYILLVVSSVLLLVLFFLSWFMCLSLRYNGQDGEVQQRPPQTKPTIAEETDFNDREKIPFY